MGYFAYLKTFVAVYRCGSHNKASDILGLTQPAISKHIAALEQQMGKQLFYRDGPKRYEATEVAHALAKELAPHIDQIEQIFNASRANTSDLQGIVYIGGLCEFAEQHLTYTISALMPHNIQFVVQQEKGVDWRRLLDNQSLDMAIVPSVIDSEVIGYRELLTDDLVIAVPNQDKAAAIQDLEDLRYIAHNEDLPCIRHYLGNLPINHALLKQSASVGSFRLIKELILSGAGFSILPRQFIRDELQNGLLQEVLLDEELPRIRLYLAWNKFALRKPRTQFVRDAILESAARFKSPKLKQPKVYEPEL
jgi:DNA-binding transcriptional LysR family regulator